MKKFTKAILSTTACVLMGACTLGLTGCIGNSTDLTETVKNISEINTTITNQTNKLEEEIKNLQEQNAQLQKQIDTIINKQKKLSNNEAWNLVNYSLLKLAIKDPTTLKTTFTQIKKDSAFIREATQIYSENHGNIINYTFEPVAGYEDDYTLPYNSELLFKHNERNYGAELINDEIFLIVGHYTTLNLSLDTFNEINDFASLFSADSISKITQNEEFTEVHLFAFYEHESALETIEKACTCIVKINNEGDIVLATLEDKALSSSVSNIDLKDYDVSYIFEFEENQENENIAEIEETIAELIKFFAPNAVRITDPNTNFYLTDEISQKVSPGDELSLIYIIKNSSGSNIKLSSLLYGKTTSFTLADQDITAECKNYFEATVNTFYSDSNLTQELASATEIEIENGQTVYLKSLLKVKDDIPSSISGISLAENDLTLTVQLLFRCEEKTN